MNLRNLKLQVLSDVDLERARQDSLWGKQRHQYGTWLAILGEEHGEVCQAIQSKIGLISSKETDSDNLYIELIHLAAVAVAIAEQVREEESEY
ncbi:hypothetical protein [Metabacillus bambusae]|uniref:Uncharacterized protein n=1 Tax=Metabacillus bambusae TaxID=2795218 RepID=A0ABS3NBC2_9BACI|nr:hypothetical protein [Metabacillus bambusae]MBO1515584.1 hypothetical protein [Metabacillus bambusae]